MAKYKHFENNYIRMTTSDSVPKKKQEDGIKISTKFGEFTFYATKIVKDGAGDPIIYFRFNHKEKLVLYLLTKHPDAGKMLNALKASIEIGNMASGSKYIVRDIMDYISNIEDTLEKSKNGEVEFKDGIHPEMKEEIEKLEKE